MQININRVVNLPKLYTELVAANLIEPSAYFGENFFIAKDDADTHLIQQIIDAHDPTPIPPQPSDKERIEQLEQVVNIMLMGGI